MTISNNPDFNTINVTGRVHFIERVTNNGSTWLKVSVISNTEKDAATTFTFNTSKMDGLFNNGFLPKGRTITISGRIKSVASHYIDEKSGSSKVYKNPRIHLENVSIPTGGLGAMPKSSAANADAVGGVTVNVDQAPAYGESTVKDQAGVAIF